MTYLKKINLQCSGWPFIWVVGIKYNDKPRSADVSSFHGNYKLGQLSSKSWWLDWLFILVRTRRNNLWNVKFNSVTWICISGFSCDILPSRSESFPLVTRHSCIPPSETNIISSAFNIMTLVGLYLFHRWIDLTCDD